MHVLYMRRFVAARYCILTLVLTYIKNRKLKHLLFIFVVKGVKWKLGFAFFVLIGKMGFGSLGQITMKYWNGTGIWEKPPPRYPHYPPFEVQKDYV